MKDNKHIKSFNEHQENLNISDVMNSKINEGVEITWDSIFKMYDDFIKGFPEKSNERRMNKNNFKNWLKRTFNVPTMI